MFFPWHTSRAAACLNTIVPVDFTGTVPCDGYAAYPAFAKGRANPIKLAGGWAQVRRKFHEASQTAPRTAGWILRHIQNLYRSEAQLRERNAGPALRAALRARHSQFIVHRLKRALQRLQAGKRFLPQSSLGSAIEYSLAQMPGLEVYLEDGRIQIDNHLVQNAIRPTAIGQKNWLCIGEAGAGDRSAILYTLIESCRRRKLDPYAYLKDVLSRLPPMTNRQIPDVTPQAWGKPAHKLLQRAS